MKKARITEIRQWSNGKGITIFAGRYIKTLGIHTDRARTVTACYLRRAQPKLFDALRSGSSIESLNENFVGKFLKIYHVKELIDEANEMSVLVPF